MTNGSASTDQEINTGVEFPGQCKESLMGTSINFEEMTFHKEVYVIEVANPNFVFKYQKEDKVFVGSCEWCNTRGQLT